MSFFIGVLLFWAYIAIGLVINFYVYKPNTLIVLGWPGIVFGLMFYFFIRYLASIWPYKIQTFLIYTDVEILHKNEIKYITWDKWVLFPSKSQETLARLILNNLTE